MVHVIAGAMTAAQARDAVTVGIDEAARRGAPLLLDIREATIAAFAYRDAFAIARAFADAADGYPHRVAVLDHYDDAFLVTQFFEASTAVRGLDVKAFVDEGDARGWLSGRELSPAA